jgi:hypothetical protein
MVEKAKPVKVVSVGGVGAGAGPVASLGVAACLALFVVNAFTAYSVLSSVFNIVGIVSGGLGGLGGIGALGSVFSGIGGIASAESFFLYLDVAAFVFLGIALIVVRVKLPQSGVSPIIGAVGAFAFAGVAYYLRFIQLASLMSSLDQIAMAGTSITSVILLGQVVLQLWSLTGILLVQGIMFFVFGLFMRHTVNNLNKSYGKMTRGGALILTVAIMNLISMVALYFGTTSLQSLIQSLIASIGGGGGGMPTLDINTMLTPLIALGIGVFLKMIIIPIMATFAFLSLTFGFYGIARGPR